MFFIIVSKGLMVQYSFFRHHRNFKTSNISIVDIVQQYLQGMYTYLLPNLASGPGGLYQMGLVTLGRPEQVIIRLFGFINCTR